MKRLAIILGLMMFAPVSFAGGTMLYMDGTSDSAQPLPALEQQQQQQQQDYEYNPNSTYFTENGIYGANANNAGTTKKHETTTKKFRVGTWRNDPNVYWNFGAVNFGSGFTTTSGGDKKY